jgi:hypothetical protein
MVDNAKAITAMVFMAQSYHRWCRKIRHVDRESLSVSVRMDDADLPLLKQVIFQQPSNICRN